MWADLLVSWVSCGGNHSPPISHHQRVGSDLAAILRLNLPIPLGVTLFRVRSGYHSGNDRCWGQYRLQPLILDHKARHDDQSDFAFLLSAPAFDKVQLTLPTTCSGVKVRYEDEVPIDIAVCRISPSR